MRLLEYYEIPGITINRHFFHIQKLALAKKAKADHLNGEGSSQSRMSNPQVPVLLIVYLSTGGASTSSSREPALLSEQALSSIQSTIGSQNIEPTPAALQALIKDLEGELSNDDFRLQYFYQKRLETSKRLEDARKKAGRQS